MASMPDIRTERASSPSPAAKRAEEQPRPEVAAKTRAQRFAEAHEWVLEHHAATFAKLAK